MNKTLKNNVNVIEIKAICFKNLTNIYSQEFLNILLSIFFIITKIIKNFFELKKIQILFKKRIKFNECNICKNFFD